MDFENKELLNLLYKVLNNLRLRNKLNDALTNDGLLEYFINNIKIFNTITPPGIAKEYYIGYIQSKPTESGFDPTLLLLRNNDIIDDFIGLAESYNEQLNDIHQEIERSINDCISDCTFTVRGHTPFYHGTSFENYKKILESGQIIQSDYTNLLSDDKAEQFFNKICSFDSGNVFVTDDFAEASFYGLRNSKNGIIISLDLDGYEMRFLYNRRREFIFDNAIPVDRIKDVYSIYVENNRIEVKKLEHST